MLDYPYLLFQSPPIGPFALEALQEAHYPPVAVVDDPKLTTEEQIALVDQYQPTFLLVVGYGSILRQPLLDTVAGQVINIHPSLLPLYRGPAPVVQALLDGATETGVTIMEIDTKMDHGPILAQEKLALRGDELPEELYKVLAVKGVHLFLNVIEDYLNERLDLVPQDHAEATITHFIKKEDGRIDWSKPARQLEREIRAYHGWPRSWFMHQEKRLIIEQAHIEGDRLVIDLVQPEGRKLMTLKEYSTGLRITPEAFYASLGHS
jgi:methionyl-tRNA formyltransferase